MAADGAQKIDGGTVREVRLALGLNKLEAAELAGVSVRTWYNYEEGRTRPYTTNLLIGMLASGGKPELTLRQLLAGHKIAAQIRERE